jgi:PA domain
LHSFVTIKFSTNRYRSLLVALILAALAIPLFAASAFAQQDPYFDPSLGVGDSIIRSDVFVGDKQGRVTATEGLFTRQMSGWLSGGAEVLKGQVVLVGRGCDTDTYLANPARKITLIERGVCTFVEKITKAYNAGAIGAIVYNNDRPNPADNDALIRMGGCGPGGPPSCPGLVPIPGFFVGVPMG